MANRDDDFFDDSASILPTDSDTPSLADNYGLDGFQFDSEYGEGTLDGGRLPEVHGLSGLPDGIVMASSDFDSGDDFFNTRAASPFDFATGVTLGEPEGSYVGTGLAEMMEENSLADLGWLHGVQDPDRLPKNPVDRSVMELEKAWGVDTRTNGLLVPNQVYRAPDGDPHHEELPRVEADELAQIVRQAARRSSYGHPIERILKDVAHSLHPRDRVLVAGDMHRLMDDHGLRGKVYIEASAFPNLKSGKWSKELHRHCASARYVVVPSSMDEGTVSRIASITGKLAVTAVPWKAAFNFYSPRLKAVGHKVASSGDYRMRLKATLASKEKVKHESSTPIQLFAVDQISVSEAKRKFARMAPDAPTAPTDPAKLRRSKEAKEAKHQISRWVQAGLLTEAQAVSLYRAAKTPHELVLTAANAISASRQAAVYSGEGKGKNRVMTAHEKSLAPLVNTETLRRAQAKEAASQQMGKWVKAGLLTTEAYGRIMLASVTPKEMIRMASEIIAQTKQASSYEGQGEGKNSVREQFHKLVANPVDASALRKAKWVMQQMNEGWAGKRLSTLIRKKFSGKTASGEIANLRAAHEGLAGFVYVDASVYASDKGSGGCDTGSLQHRANTLRYVLAMDRCASCVFATEGKCQKYAKTLLDSSDGLEKIQRKNIRAADSSDAMDTASLFAPSFNEEEYDLGYDDTVEIDDAEDVEMLDGILMDGMASDDDDVYGGLNFDDVGF